MCLGVPGKVVSIEDVSDTEKIGKVEFGGVLKEVSLVYVPEVKIGQYVVVHVGFALSLIDEEEAEEIFECVKQYDDDMREQRGPIAI